MDELDLLREKTKALLRSGTPTVLQYEEALPLCRKLWEAFPETSNFWDVHQYAHCLKRIGQIDEAEKVCDTVHTQFKDLKELSEWQRPFTYIKNLYAWIINDKYIKTIRQQDYPHGNILVTKLILLCELIENNDSSSPSIAFCILTGLSQLTRVSSDIDYSKVIYLLEKLDVTKLSSVANQYTDKQGKLRETPSQKEQFYKLKSDALLRMHYYEECIICCNEAIESLEQFHYENDVWFERKIAMALAQIGNVNDAVEKLKKLIPVTDKWFILSEIGKFYLRLNQLDYALEYMLRALCTKEPEKMKVNLIEATGDLLQQIGERDFAQENYIFAREIRKENNWFVKDELTNKIQTDQIITFIEIRKKWINRLYRLVGEKQGKISKIFPNKGGFIQSDISYYFQFKNFFGKTSLVKVGDAVAFITTKSYDRKKQIETEEAVVITPLRHRT